MLRDILHGFGGDASRNAASDLGSAITANAAGDRDTGSRLASQAAAAFRSANNHAAELRAREEVVYGLSRSFRSSECLDESSRLLSALGDQYPWMQVQVLLARATCAGRLSDIGSEFTLKRRAIQIAEAHGYGTLTLRAIGLMATASTLVDDLNAAQREDHDGLQRFWGGAYPPLRAYQFYSDLSEIAKREGHWTTGYETSSEAVPMIQQSGNRATEAMARYRLAMFAGLTGKAAEARDQMRSADSLLSRFENSSSAGNLRAESLIQMAQAYLEQGQVSQAEATLDAVRDRDIQPALLLKLAFHRLRGELAQRANQSVLARQSFETAYQVAESALKTVRSPRDRANWEAEAAPLYRQLVRLILADEKDSDRALAIWEKFRSDSAGLGQSGAGDVNSLRKFAATLHSVTVLSFVQFDDSLAGWLLDDRGLTPFRAPLSAPQAKQACEEFFTLASDPSSNLSDVNRKGARLYNSLLGLVKGKLQPGRTLAIEPDGPCSAIPFEALVGDDGAYLADHFTILTSPGTVALDRWRSRSSPLTTASRTVVVADPRLDGDMASQYPELADARREGEAVAHLFPRASFYPAHDATIETVAPSLRQADIFHFAGHGVLAGGNGALLFAASGKSSGAAYFDAGQVEASPIHCRLAV
ncbi:MAG TPA: CHAT domain-containing protein, partial [Bryobacteraceae bacterium]